MALENLTKRMWLNLYKNLMTQAKQLTNYNHREYAIRRIRDHFRSKIVHADEKQLYTKGLDSLSSLKRQVALNKLYAGPKLVIENPRFKIPE